MNKWMKHLPRAANEMNACACLRILSWLTSGHFLFLIGSRINSSSRKSSGVTDEMSHLRRLSTQSSQCWKEYKLKYLISLNNLSSFFFSKVKRKTLYKFDEHIKCVMSIYGKKCDVNNLQKSVRWFSLLIKTT